LTFDLHQAGKVSGGSKLWVRKLIPTTLPHGTKVSTIKHVLL